MSVFSTQHPVVGRGPGADALTIQPGWEEHRPVESGVLVDVQLERSGHLRRRRRVVPDDHLAGSSAVISGAPISRVDRADHHR